MTTCWSTSTASTTPSLPPDKKELIHEVLTWYKTNHPIWFKWLEME